MDNNNEKNEIEQEKPELLSDKDEPNLELFGEEQQQIKPDDVAQQKITEPSQSPAPPDAHDYVQPIAPVQTSQPVQPAQMVQPVHNIPQQQMVQPVQNTTHPQQYGQMSSNAPYNPYVSSEQPSYRPVNNNQENITVQEKQKKGPMIVIILLVILLIAGLIVFSLLSLDNDVSESANKIGSDSSAQEDKDVVKPDESTKPTDKPDRPRTSKPGSVELSTATRASEEPYTTPDVAEMVTPAVVGVLQYQSSLYEASGLGSGVIIGDFDGGYYVVTNNHVVYGASDFKVRLDDGVEIVAEVVGVDPQSDLAVLRIKTDAELTVAKIGDSDLLRRGETVIAIGNPLAIDFSGSVTQGIVSALNRTVTTEYKINYIQTDAAINPGNSGGALVNMYGELIGINTVKVQGTGLEGMGFAIPISEAKPVIEELINYGKVTTRPVLGIEGVAIDAAMAYRYGYTEGVMIKGVGKNAKFEVDPEPDDIITHVEDVRIKTLAELKSELDKYKIGDTIELTLSRESSGRSPEDVKIKVTLVGSD